MFKWYKKWRKSSKETFVVQLHVMSENGVVFDYEEISVRRLEEARSVARKLRRDNGWASANLWPRVTIHNNYGEWFPEDKKMVIFDGDGNYTPWTGR